jgi:SpoVK/Ycf46/Vps4 family AAA+-type ATPase
VAHQGIYQKQLFYNPDTRTKVEQLEKILIAANLRKYVKMAHKHGEPGGIISLLSGNPGTGKTELARQLALQTGRDLLVFDVTQQRNMYYGESEKAIKQVFDDYRRICKHSPKAPILFFNEGDAVFSQRTETRGNTTQTENSIQTILLQELEIFEGIMLITTNRPNSFDAAFSRRILLKIEILDPIAEVRFELLRHLFPALSEVQAKHLAENFTFTAAELGVFRKQWELNAIIRMKCGTLYHALDDFLQALNQKTRQSIGFVAA